MTTKFNVGDDVLIKGIVETIYIETTDNEPIYHVRIKGAGTYEAYGVRVKEDVMKDGTPIPRITFQLKTVANAKEANNETD